MATHRQQETLKHTYLHAFRINDGNLKSAVTNITKTSGEIKILIEIGIVANAFVSTKIPKLLKLVGYQPAYE